MLEPSAPSGSAPDETDHAEHLACDDLRQSGACCIIRGVFPLAALGLCLAAELPPAERPIVVLLPRSSQTASVAAQHLGVELGRPLSRQWVEGADPRVSLDAALDEDPDRIVVYLHPEGNEAWLAWSGADEPVVRKLLDPPESPAYPLAIAAAELVRNVTVNPPPRPSAPVELAFSLGLGLAAAGGDEGPSAQPVFGLDLRHRRGGFWGSVGLRLRGPTSTSHDAPVATTIEYRRTDLAARFALGPELGDWVVSGVFELGTSRVSVEAFRDGAALGSNARWPVWLAGGAELRRPIGLGFGVFACAQAIHVFAPVDFTGDGEFLFSEGRWRFQGQVGLEWAL